MFGSQLNKYELWVAVAGHNFKWVKIYFLNVALQGLKCWS